MWYYNSKIYIFLILATQLVSYCYAQECSNLNLTVLDKHDGFSGFFWQYISEDEWPTTHDYLLRYMTQANVDEIGYVNSVSDLNFQIEPLTDGSSDTVTLFNNEINASNFTLSVTGNFIPKITGDYTFSITADDAAMMMIVSDLSFYCCNDVTLSSDDPIKSMMDLMEKYYNLIEYTGSTNDADEITLSLTADQVVPLGVVVINRSEGSMFNLTITDPNGESFSDLNGYVFDIDEDISCNKETAITETASVETKTTYSSTTITTLANVLGLPEYQTTYYVQVPFSALLSISSARSSSAVISSSTSNSEFSSTVVSSSTESSGLETSSMQSLTLSSYLSSSVISSSTESTSISFNSLSSSGIASLEPSSSTKSNSIVSSTINSDISSTAISDSVVSLDISSSSITYLVSSSVQSSVNLFSSTIDSSIVSAYAPSSTLSSAVSSNIASTLTQSSNVTSDSMSSSTTGTAYFNSSKVISSVSTFSDVMTESSAIILTSKGESSGNSKTTVTIPCSSGHCQTISTQSTKVITEASILTSTITKLCSVTHSNSIEVVTATYITKMTTVATYLNCQGGCSTSVLTTIWPESLDDSVVPEITGSECTSSSSYVVKLNENRGTKPIFDVFAIAITIISALTFL
ncbi:similar to Saccharomyces cerevisiae FLO5 YHR211W Lectin-like cell wall protein (flocculin) involved in flocculation [Maudiozyma saulgeensis]|uniref:Similar to Saccharomyces cerevisiae FLO5 YHR211W Lectin-like cell wall protein (Flocculin) involved in flocculation n=1 Tax=Maudiozyma saulgeensis TaxID=1789683 RepID=A0A1X7QWY8_9SACH|nr:similar to Saccharomyces cerevisiae FLO5 YHR211W Lectin-like cell wall protein (flocculin) involved in flocculation [Kazachstania saulgeensis]